MASQANSKKGRKYDQTFKEQVLQKVRNGASVPSVDLELGISEGIIYAWKQKNEQQDDSRLATLERKNAQLRQWNCNLLLEEFMRHVILMSFRGMEDSPAPLELLFN